MSKLRFIALVAGAAVVGTVTGTVIGNQIAHRRAVAARKEMLQEQDLVEPLVETVQRNTDQMYSTAMILFQRDFDRLFLEAYPMRDNARFHGDGNGFGGLAGYRMKRKVCSLYSQTRRVLAIEVSPGNNVLVYERYRNCAELMVVVPPAIAAAHQIQHIMTRVDNENVDTFRVLLKVLNPL